MGVKERIQNIRAKVQKFQEKQEFQQQVRAEQEARRLEKKAEGKGKLIKRLERQEAARKTIEKAKKLQQKIRPKIDLGFGNLGLGNLGGSGNLNNSSPRKRKRRNGNLFDF